MNKGNHITWNKAYDLGVEDIDFQHHFFVNLINRLANELVETTDPDYQLGLISELNAYAKFHFISEENMMRREAYPKWEEHRQLHVELIDQLSAKENLLYMNPSSKTVDAIMDFLVNWFLIHTSQEDRLFTDFLHEKNGEQSLFENAIHAA